MNRSTTLLVSIISLLVSPTSCMAAVGRSPSDYASRLDRLSSSLRLFQATFDVVDRHIPPPAEYTAVTLRHQLAVLEAKAHETPRESRAEWLAFQRRILLSYFQEEGLPSVRKYRAGLAVSGVKICWKEPKQIICYDGKDLFIVNNPVPIPGDPTRGLLPSLPTVQIRPKFDIIDSQQIPFYGALHPMMPMFTIADLRAATASHRGGWWKVRASDRGGGISAGRIRFDCDGRPEEFWVFMGGNADEAHLLEKWKFLGWRERSGQDFPTRVISDRYVPAPFGARRPVHTARTRHVELSLSSFTCDTPPESMFSFWKPSVGSFIHDERYPALKTYQYGVKGRMHTAERPTLVPRLVALVVALLVMQLCRAGLRLGARRTHAS